MSTRINLRAADHGVSHGLNGSDSAPLYGLIRPNPSIKTTLSTTYAKVKQSTILFPASSLLIGFEMCNPDGYTSCGKVYRNGVAVGAENTLIGGSYTVYAENISAVWASGDTIELWAKTSNGAHATHVKNFNIYGSAGVALVTLNDP